MIKKFREAYLFAKYKILAGVKINSFVRVCMCVIFDFAYNLVKLEYLLFKKISDEEDFNFTLSI